MLLKMLSTVRHTTRIVSMRWKGAILTTKRNATFENFSVIYETTGKPTEVLQGRQSTIDSGSLSNNEVFVKMLASPINPSDINIIEGMYPVKLPLPNTAGKEGVGKVIKIGGSVKDLSVGDIVIPDNTVWGAWTNYVKAPSTDFVKCPSDVPHIAAATMMVNSCTALRMLADFEDMKPGDVVVQNGSNSGAGQSVIQIAAAKGLQSVNIIRDRENLDEMVVYLKTLGATHVVTEDFAKSPEMKGFMSQIRKPKLALNCVGGRSASQLLKLLRGSGTMVTYGGMSMSPVSIPTSVFIFQDVKLTGFWMSKWHQMYKNTKERADMFDELFCFARDGKLIPPQHNFSPLTDFKEAVKKAMESSAQKQIFKISD